ncbi:MAG: 3-phosphoshikimate 1-carboxyvinyltransferase, partial [Clostridiales bacterium]|nr:3-phosphoshikimate 1-carboxyvinyltransferase [Clostridiales bacterium]
TGLLYALPLCEADSDLVLTTALESAGYVEMTLSALRRSGITIEPAAGGWHIPGGQSYRAADVTVEGDWSQAAFLLAAGALGGDITVTGLDSDSPQGDRACVELLRRFGAPVEEINGGYRCRRAPLHGIDIDARQIPDLVPVLAATAALAEGTTRITGAARLRIKESDRLHAMAEGLNRLGGQAEELPDGLLIRGVKQLRGGEADGFNDHRVVMSLAVAALRSSASVTIHDAQSISKSWPNFWTDYTQIGGIAHVIDDR